MQACSTSVARICRATGKHLSDIHVLDNEAAVASTDFFAAGVAPLRAAVDQGQVLVACVDDEVGGYVHVDLTTPGAQYISGLVVRPDLRERGLGRRLLVKAWEHLVDPCRPMFTVTSPTNRNMVRLLLSFGFVGTAPLTDHFGPEHHRVRLDLCVVTPARRAMLRWRADDGFATWCELAADGNVVVASRGSGERAELGCDMFKPTRVRVIDSDLLDDLSSPARPHQSVLM